MTKKNQHVVPHEGGWAVRKEGSKKVTRKTRTQHEAIEVARQFAQNQSSEVVIHRPDGTIRDKDSYGKDPHPPKDTKH